MNTNTFFNRISRVFKPQNLKKETMSNEWKNTENPMQTINSTTTPPATNMKLTPVVTVQPAVRPVSMASVESQSIETSDLASWAMDQCISLNGNVQGLISSLETILMNYKLEAKAREEEMKGELVNAINQINDEIISLNNQIAIIREFHIPEKEKLIAQFEQQIRLLENNTTYDLHTEIGNETYTILATSIARTRELIREFYSKIKDLTTSIQQHENKINTMREQLKNIQIFNEDIILRRMHIFFNGWLTGLVGIGATSILIENTKSIFKDYNQKESRKFIELKTL